MSLETENQDGTNEIHWHSRQFSAWNQLTLSKISRIYLNNFVIEHK
jgi:hypothetical protein